MRDSRNESYERVKHIQNAISQIESFTKNVDKNDFLNDVMLVSAVLFQFTVIGEAIIHVESSLLEKYKYPWFKVRAFRNLISHEYFQIKFEAVWSIIIKDLPKLKQIINVILENEF